MSRQRHVRAPVAQSQRRRAPLRGGRVLVCAVAGLEEAEHPVAVARELAERLMDELVLVHVAAPAPPASHGGGLGIAAYPPLEHAKLETAAAGVLDAISTRFDLGQVRRRPLVGDPATAVLGVAEELDADLIVVGSRRHGPFVSALLGSVSHAIGDATDRPVVVVPSGGALPHLTPVRCIVCGVDGSPESRRAVQVANDLAGRLQVRLVLAYAEPASAPGGLSPLRLADMTRFLEELAASERLPPETLLRAKYGAAAAALEEVAAEEGAGLIVVGRRGGLLRDLFHGSVSAALSAHARQAVVLA